MMFTQRERRKCAESLVCLLQALVGHRTTLELRNEITVTGTIEDVDSCMNTVLRAAETVKLNGEKELFDEFTVRGAQIRYVHIPDSIDVMAAIQKQVSVLVGRGGGDYRRKQVSRGTRRRHLQERRIAREHKLGRGRGGEDRGGGRGVGTGGGGGVKGSSKETGEVKSWTEENTETQEQKMQQK